MSEYMFGCGRGTVPKRQGSRLDRIAKKHGAGFQAVHLPEGPQYWFYCPNRGHPFDWQTQHDVLAEAEKAGLWPINKGKT